MTQTAPHPHRDIKDLAAFGYRQRLDRRLGGFSSFAAGFSYLSILTGLPQLFFLGFGAAGPAFFWTWPVVLLGQFLVALCFAELAAFYPISGGVYQWSKQVGRGGVGWMAGWVYLACSAITIASVALALQSTLPQVSPVFQLIGNPENPADAARNAVLLGCVLVAFSTVINALSVRTLARINNVGVFAEMAGALLLIVLLFAHIKRGPLVVFHTMGRGTGHGLGFLAPFLAAALTPSFVMYGFEAAGSLAEETANPRRRAPWAVLGSLGAVGLTGALLILAALSAAVRLDDPELGKISGGMPYIIKQALGPEIGLVLLCDVAFAVTVCTLTVHASAVRLMFAMARDNNLPCSRALARLPESSRTPVVPALLLGAGALVLLLFNVNFPQVIQVMVSVSIVWANLAYLFVTVPLLVRRLRGGLHRRGLHSDGHFTLGRWGLPVNLLAVVWGIAIVTNIGWPRPEVYGEAWYRRYSAPLSTAVMLGAGGLYYGLVRRHRTVVLDDHRAADDHDGPLWS